MKTGYRYAKSKHKRSGEHHGIRTASEAKNVGIINRTITKYFYYTGEDLKCDAPEVRHLGTSDAKNERRNWMILRRNDRREFRGRIKSLLVSDPEEIKMSHFNSSLV